MYVVKVPGINGLGKTKGCEKGGQFVLEAFKEIHSNMAGKPLDYKLLDLEEVHLDNSNVEASNSLIYKNSFKFFETQPRIFL